MTIENNFNKIDWELKALGLKEKVISYQNKLIRLVRLEDNFIEDDWCTKSHFGYILRGEMKIDYDGEIVTYRNADVLCIKNNHRHKAIIEQGKFTEIILFENVSE